MNVPMTDRHQHAAQEIESAALRELHEAADDTLRRRIGLHLHETGGALVSAASGDPGIVINRTTGLGVFTPASRSRIDELVTIYRDAGVARYFVQHHPRAVPPELPEWLAAAGLVPQRAWMKFRHDLAALPEDVGAPAPEPVDADRARELGAIVADGFDLQPETGALLSRLAGRPRWHPFMVRIDGEIAGGAALYVHEGMGWCDWAATRPTHRGRGVQRALLAARLRLARELGCDAVYTTTGVAVPGEAQPSYHNILDAGFRELYVSDNYAPLR